MVQQVLYQMYLCPTSKCRCGPNASTTWHG